MTLDEIQNAVQQAVEEVIPTFPEVITYDMNNLVNAYMKRIALSLVFKTKKNVDTAREAGTIEKFNVLALEKAKTLGIPDGYSISVVNLYTKNELIRLKLAKEFILASQKVLQALKKDWNILEMDEIQASSYFKPEVTFRFQADALKHAKENDFEALVLAEYKKFNFPRPPFKSIKVKLKKQAAYSEGYFR